MLINSKKLLIIILVLIFLGGAHFAQAETFTRDIGAGRISTCACNGNEGLVCNCTCQSVNRVDNCQVGWLIKDPVCACCGDCTLQNFLDLGVNVANQILKYLGVAALFLLVIGGLIWITSGGSAEKVQKGKKIVSGAIIGLIVVLFSYTLVSLMMKTLRTESYLPSAQSEDSSDWPVCPELSLIVSGSGNPWCYGCNWTGTGQGCQSSQVRSYQEKLNEIGCDCGKNPDGFFGPQTRQCIIRFQQANDLGSDGLVGPTTAEKLLIGGYNPCQ